MDSRAEVPFGEPAGEIAIGSDQYGDTRKRPRQHQRLVPCFVEAGDDPSAIGHHGHTVFRGAASVAPGKHGRLFAFLQEQPRDVLDDGRFPAASDAKVADTDDGPLELTAP